MIKYVLKCASCEEEYDSWFASSEAYTKLKKSNAVVCPVCDSIDVDKAVMAPNVSSSNQSLKARAFEKFANKARAHIAKNFDHVGNNFAGQARAMHDGDMEAKPIWGQVSEEQREALIGEGVPVTPIPEELAPPVPKDENEVN